ncbi:MAG: hypothetical protein U1E65_34790 [Myxococcota bacterium]
MKLSTLFLRDRTPPGLTEALKGENLGKKAAKSRNQDRLEDTKARGLELPRGAEIEPLLELPRLSLTRPSPTQVPKAEGVLQGLWSRALDLTRGSVATREVNRAKKVAAEVNALEPKIQALSDPELKAQTAAFQETIQHATQSEREALAKAEQALATGSGSRAELREAAKTARVALYKAEQKILDKIMPEAFATVREAARRATKMRHYDVQVQGGALMHHGMIAEMYTGEGKTLAATLPAYLNALAGHGFHVATVNDYLAKRDAEEMGAIYTWLGLSVGILQGGNKQLLLSPGDAEAKETGRKSAYQADITYGTASEFGFDFLRDNQVMDPDDRVQRPLYGALFDEVDSLLIDEARIPLILAGKGPAPDLALLEKYNTVAEQIYKDVTGELESGKKKKGQIFDKDDVEWEEHWVALTDKGQEKVQKLLGIPDLFGADSPSEVSDKTKVHPELSFMQDALKAWFILHENGQYAVVDGKISTVGLSGHLGPGRRFTGGLHQALEMKHKVEVLPENATIASVTMRDYLGLYKKSAGMTGTAMSARSLFMETYRLDVARVDTRAPLIRIDYPDKTFATLEEKTQQFLSDVKKAHQTGRPLLIGVEFTHTAEWLGQKLKEMGLPVNVLGAKDDDQEASIIANAGRRGAITVATTRGGRGVDIKLGGNAKILAEELVNKGLGKEQALTKAAEMAAKERGAVLGMGGLLVMSFEHLDSRRRDDQLRGRAARQGEPGATIFYTSAEDRLFDDVKKYQDIKAKKAELKLSSLPKDTEQALDHSENKVNGGLSESLPYDQVIANYRDKFYTARADVLEGTDARPLALTLIEQAVDNAFGAIEGKHGTIDTAEKARALFERLDRFLPMPKIDPAPHWTGRTLDSVRADVDKLVGLLIDKRDKEAGGIELARLVDKASILGAADQYWSEFIDATQTLKDSIGFRAMAQKDPKMEFLRDAGLTYGEMLDCIAEDVAARVLTQGIKLPPALAQALKDLPPPDEEPKAPS